MVLIGIGLSDCSKIRKTEAEKQREEWIESFSDSISYYQNQAKALETSLDELHGRIEAILPEFEKTENPREVAGVYIMKGWKEKLPMLSSGIYARINEREGLEIIATLGGATFNQIGVGEGSEEILSDVVRHDQAFNYRHERYNTVCFSGEKADSVAAFIADNYREKINLKFIEGEKKRNFNIPENEKNMIRQTWLLYSNQTEAKKLEKELWIASKKIETFRRIMEMQNEKPEN